MPTTQELARDAFLARVNTSGSLSDKELLALDSSSTLPDNRYSNADLKSDVTQAGGGSVATGDELLRSAELYYRVQNKPGFPGCLPNLGVGPEKLALWGGGASRSTIDQGFVTLPGRSGNYITTPDVPKLRATTRLEVRILVALPNPDDTSEATKVVISKSSGSGRDWDLSNKSRMLELVWSTPGGAQVAQSTSKWAFTTNPIWLSFVIDLAAGSVSFYTGTNENSLRQLGSTLTGFPTGLTSSVSPVLLGSWDGSNYNPAGKYYQAKIIVDGVLQGYFNAANLNQTTSGVASTGETWTVVRSTTTSDPRYLPYQGRKYVYMPPQASAGNVIRKSASAPVLALTGDLDIRVNVDRIDSFTDQHVFVTLLGDYVSNGWSFLTNVDKIRFACATNPTGYTDYNSSSCPVKPWYRVTRVAATGVGTFYWSDDGFNWTQVGSSAVNVGAIKTAGSTLLSMADGSCGAKCYYVEIRNGLNGPVIESWSASSFNGWAITRAGANSLNAVLVDSKDCYLFGVDDVFATDAVYPNYQVGLNESFTAVVCCQRWFDAVSYFQMIFGHNSPAGVPAPGWSIFHDNADRGRIKGSSGQTEAAGTSILGSKVVLSLVRNRSDGTLKLYQNKTMANSIVEITPDDPYAQNQLHLGNIFGGNPMGAEFFEAAFFRSALDQSGINSIVDAINA